MPSDQSYQAMKAERPVDPSQTSWLAELLKPQFWLVRGLHAGDPPFLFHVLIISALKASTHVFPVLADPFVQSSLPGSLIWRSGNTSR